MEENPRGGGRIPGRGTDGHGRTGTDSRLGRIHQVRKGRPRWEALYVREEPEGHGETL